MLKTLKKSSSPEPVDQWQLVFACSIGYPSISKIIQMMTWIDLDLFYGKIKHGKILEHKISWKILKLFAQMT